jgi:hypothetical protein
MDVSHFSNKHKVQLCDNKIKNEQAECVPEKNQAQPPSLLGIWSLLLPICLRPHSPQKAPAHMTNVAERSSIPINISTWFSQANIHNKHDMIEISSCWCMLDKFGQSLSETIPQYRCNLWKQ